MKVKKQRLVVVGFIVLSLPAAPLVRAQYTADYQTNLISGVTSNWAGNYLVGSNTFADVLLIQNGGVLSNGYGRLGYLASSSNNSVLVTGTGSVWSNQSGLSVGTVGSGNSLVISNGGRVVNSSSALIGDGPGSRDNSVVVTGSGTVWNTSVVLGSHGPNNRLVISDGGQLIGSCSFGSSSMSSNNSILVSGANSTLNNSGDLSLVAPGNSLVISNGGYVADDNGVFNGRYGTVVVADVGSVWSNRGTLTVYNWGNCLVISNGGKVVNSVANVGFDQHVGSTGNTVIVSGPGSVWNNNSTLTFGVYSPSNNLVIDHGGKLVNRFGYVGNDPTATGNSVVISDTDSVWSNSMDLYVGRYGGGNQLTINNGARVVNSYAYVGYDGASQSNGAVVSGPDSTWENSSTLVIGYAGCHNSLVISNGGRVTSPHCIVGSNPTGCGHSVLVDGSGSRWSDSGTLTLGDMGSSCSLVITNGGRVASRSGYIGRGSGSWYNRVLVAGSGSSWSNSTSLYVGYAGTSNSLTIIDAGQVVSGGAYVGSNYSSSRNNNALVSGPGSTWSSSGPLYVGFSGVDNTLVISNGGQVIDTDGFVGYNSSNNNVRVADGAIWHNDTLRIGNLGSSNALVVAGGSVLATNLTVGVASAGCDNLVQLDSGSVIVTNATTNAVLEVRNGKLILNGGTLKVDRFVMTNTCAQFVRTGGAFIYGTAVLDPTRDDDGDGMPNGWEQSHALDPLNPADANVDSDGDGFSNMQEYQAGTDPTSSASVFRIIEIWPEDDDLFLTWTAVGGKRYALQTTRGDGGSFSNNFIDLNPAIIAPGTSETVVSVLHLGAATNFPSRYYRVRLVP